MSNRIVSNIKHLAVFDTLCGQLMPCVMGGVMDQELRAELERVLALMREGSRVIAERGEGSTAYAAAELWLAKIIDR